MDGPQQNFAHDFSLPPVTNPPQPIFNGQSQNTSPLLPDFGFGDELDDGLNDDANHGEGGGSKRRRIARACDMCRKKKIKCDGGMPSCKNCINYKTECIFTQVEKKRSPPKSAKYIEGLENRLGRMESLLRMSGLLNNDGDKTNLGALEKQLANQRASNTPERSPNSGSQPRTQGSQHSTPQMEKIHTPNSSGATPDEAPQEKEAAVEELSDMMCSLVTNNCGETRYIGSSSSFSIFSPKGIQWVNEKTGDTSFQDMVTSASVQDIKWAYWKPEVFGDMFQRRTYQQLPSRDEALSLMRDFFENFNCMFPLFHEPTFMHLVNRNYSKDPFEGSGWWASFNVALAIAHRLRVMSHLVPQDEDRKAWGYLKNAMGVFTELTMRNTDLLSVQALLGMALFLLGTPNPQPSFFLVAAAIRLANSIGLHKRGSGFNLNEVEIEQRKRVFWIAYLLDKDICLRSGRPPAQDDDDMNVEMPTDDPKDNIGNIPLADGKGKANLFKFMVEFAVIESKVYKQLYSTKASKQSDGELLNTIGELDKELEDWKDRIPIDIRPEHEIKATHTPLVLHVVVLHFAYYNCLTTIHRMSVHHGFWTSRLSNYAIQGLNARPLNPRVFSSAALCVQAARASIHLIRYIPQGDYSCVWLILYFPVSALVTLFANILQNPNDPRARTDVKLMNQVVNFLSLLSVTEEQGGVKRMLGVCAAFERIARVVLDKSGRGGRHRRKTSKATNNEDNGTNTTPRQVPKKRPADANLLAPNTNGNTNGLNANTTTTPPRDNPHLQPANNASAPDPFNPNSFSPSLPNIDLPLDFPTPNSNDFTSMLNTPSSNPQAGGAAPPTGDMNYTTQNADAMAHFPTDNPTSALNMGAFQQPFVPQDLWNMPMTLEWDWADMNIDGLNPPANGDGDGDGGRGGGGEERTGLTPAGSGQDQDGMMETGAG